MSLARSRLLPLRQLAVAVPLLAMGASGCSNEEQSGSLTINYQFGAASASCADSLTTQIRVSLNGQQFAEQPCDDTGSITLPSVPARNYSQLLVEGIDVEGTTVRDNLAPPTDDESVEVVGGAAVVKEDVVLTPTPAIVRFQFVVLDETGAPYPPAATPPIKLFRTEAFRQNGNTSLLAHDFVYADLMTTLVDMPDPQRDLEGDLLDFISVRIVDQSDSTIDTLTEMVVPPGPGKLVQVRVDCRGTACTSSLEVMSGEIDPTEGDTDTDTDSGNATDG